MQAKFTPTLFEKDLCHMNPHDPYEELRAGVRSVVTQFDSRYWQELDEARAFPEKFVNALAAAGWLSALIPEEYGGSNLSLTEASVIMEEINHAGGNSGACHGQMYVMGCVVRHGSKAQKEALLPKIASGELRMQAADHGRRIGRQIKPRGAGLHAFDEFGRHRLDFTRARQRSEDDVRVRPHLAHACRPGRAVLYEVSRSGLA
jgi:hypothetical protein